MNLVVDTNIVFSVLLNTNSKAGEILLNSIGLFNFISIDYLKIEIQKHRSKIIKNSKYSEYNFDSIVNLVYSRIDFIDFNNINKNFVNDAYKLTCDIDPNDTLFVALSLQEKCKLWTGDKKLIKGLIEKGFYHTIETKNVFNLFSSRN